MKKSFTLIELLIVLAIIAILAGILIVVIKPNSNKRLIDKSQGLVGYWSFDEGSVTTAGDSSENNNHGTIYGSTWVNGKIGKALNFDGMDDYVEIRDNLGISPSQSFTFTGWVYLKTAVSTENQYFISKVNRAAIRGHFTGNPNFWMVWLYNDNTYGGFNTYLDIRFSWHHVAMVFDTSLSKMFLYLDGVKSGEREVVKPLSVGGNYYIGTWYPNGGRILAIIDEVRIYNRALSAEEIKALYEATK